MSTRHRTSPLVTISSVTAQDRDGSSPHEPIFSDHKPAGIETQSGFLLRFPPGNIRDRPPSYNARANKLACIWLRSQAMVTPRSNVELVRRIVHHHGMRRIPRNREVLNEGTAAGDNRILNWPMAAYRPRPWRHIAATAVIFAIQCCRVSPAFLCRHEHRATPPPCRWSTQQVN